MKMKKYAILLSMLIVVSVIMSACGGSGNNAANNGSASGGKGSGKQEQKTVTIFQFKTEIVEGLNELKVEFENEYPNIKLDIQTVGGGADYDAAQIGRAHV